MATQICPKCKQDSFTWHLDDELTDLTIWGCHSWFYQAFEDESKEGKCNLCGKGFALHLKDEEKSYWWCPTCESTEVMDRND